MMLYEAKKSKDFCPVYPENDPRNARAMDNYLRVLFLPLIKKYFPYHYLSRADSVSYQYFMDQYSSTHRYFLHFNIHQFYENIVNYSIGPVLLDNYEMLYGFAAPEHLCNHLLTGPERWFVNKPWNKGHVHEKNLLYIAAGAYLLGLCLSIVRWPFLNYHSDYMVLFRTEAEINECIDIVNFELARLNLKLDQNSIRSGCATGDEGALVDFSFNGSLI